MNLVRLVDGRLVDSSSAAWRAECLARHVLAIPTLIERREWLAKFEARHGQASAESLRETMLVLRSARQSA